MARLWAPLLAVVLLACSLPSTIGQIGPGIKVAAQDAAALDRGSLTDGTLQRRTLQGAADAASSSGAAASATAPAPDSTSTGVAVPPVADAPACSVRLANSVETFDACAPLTGTPGNYTFAWKLLANNQLRGAIDGIHPERGFIGWGQGTYRMMVPGNAVIVKPNATSPTGASAAAYHLGDYDESAVKQSSDWKVTDIEAAAGTGGRLTAAFTLDLDSTDGSKDSFPVIYVMGPVGADGDLNAHDPDDAGAATLDLQAATVTKEEARGEDESPKREHNLPTIHGWLAGVGLGILLPLGVLFPFVLRDTPAPFWFNMHRLINILGFLLGVAAIATGLYMKPFVGNEEDKHKSIGVVVLVLLIFQVLAVVLRPKPDSKLRKFWNPVHHWAGRILLVLIVVDMYIGIHMSDHIVHGRRNWYIVYSVLLGAIVLFAVAKAFYNIGTHGGLKGSKKRAVHPVSDEEKSIPLGTTAGGSKAAPGNGPDTSGAGIASNGAGNGYTQV